MKNLVIRFLLISAFLYFRICLDAQNVGIGIGSPNYELQIHDSTSQSVLQFTTNATGITDTDGLLVGQNTPMGEVLIWNWENQDMEFGTNGTQRMRIKANGNVGIGTGSPNYNLHIHGASIQPLLQLTSSATGTTINDGLIFGLQSYDGDVMILNAENKDILIATNASEKMRIQANGNVGIGTSSSDYRLEVRSATTRTGNFVNTATTLDNYGIYGSCLNTPYYGYGVYGKGGWIGVAGEAALSGNGNRYGLYGLASGGTDNNWAVYSVGSSYATGTWQTSDEMFKKDIRPIENALEILKLLEPRSYNFNTEEYSYMGLPAEPQFGFLAQDMENVLPELVRNIEQPIDHTSREKGMIEFKGINYTELIPLTIAALQEQQTMIEVLQSENQELKAELTEIKKRLGME